MGKPVRNIQYVKKGKKGIDVSVVIISDRAGYRMKSYGPLPLLSFLGRKKLIDYQIKVINRHLKVKEIILIVGFKADQILKSVTSEISIIENINYENNNVLKSMAIGTNASTTKNILYIDGNTLMSSNFFSRFQPKFSQIFLREEMTDQEEPVGSVVNKNNEVEHSFFSVTRNYWQNIIFLTGTELEIFKTFCNNEDKNRWYNFEATNEITNKGGQLLSYYPDKFLININTPKQIKKAIIYANNHS